MNAVKRYTVATTLRLLTRPHLQLRSHGARVHVDRFEAWLGGELICVSRQPRLDGARELLRRGYSPDTLMTTRAHDRNYDSWTPAPLGELAEWTIVEKNRGGLSRRKWEPFEKADWNARSAPPVEGRARGMGLRGQDGTGGQRSSRKAPYSPWARGCRMTALDTRADNAESLSGVEGVVIELT